jgi:hypothetical protein
MNTSLVKIEKPEEVNVIFGMTHFIKTVEDLHEILVGAVPGIKFGLAFCEASQERLVRFSGTDDDLTKLAVENMKNIGCGHSFLILLGNVFPITVLNQVKLCPEVCRIFCATANPVEVVVAESEQGKGVLGVIDGFSPVGVESEENIKVRKEFLRKIGYKF